MRRVTILGATGSIGTSTLDVVAGHPDDYSIVALTAQHNVTDLARAARHHKAQLAVIGDESLYDELKSQLQGSDVQAAAGQQAIIDAAAQQTDCVIVAILGIAALRPVEAALKQCPIVGLANKETLVAAGALVMDMARQHQCRIVPVDSEHSAIFQLFDEQQRNAIASVILTASGGAFLHHPLDQLHDITTDEAVRHPNWDMGAKISVDSATMMNKALELIEACHLFELDESRIEVVIHPQSIVHSAVRYVDGSVLAHMGTADMRTPIAYALSYPQRMKTAVAPLDFSQPLSLEFMPPDDKRFPSLSMARQAYRAGNGASIAFNAANEVAVAAFLDKRISFPRITQLVGEVLEGGDYHNVSSWDDVEKQDQHSRAITQKLMGLIDNNAINPS